MLLGQMPSGEGTLGVKVKFCAHLLIIRRPRTSWVVASSLISTCRSRAGSSGNEKQKVLQYPLAQKYRLSWDMRHKQINLGTRGPESWDQYVPEPLQVERERETTRP